MWVVLQYPVKRMFNAFLHNMLRLTYTRLDCTLYTLPIHFLYYTFLHPFHYGAYCVEKNCHKNNLDLLSLK